MAWASYVVGGKNFTANFDGGYSPTDGTNTQQGGAAVSAAPTKLLLTPQNARNTRNLLLRETPTDSTDLHRCLGAFKGVHLSPLGFAACQSKKYTNQTATHPTECTEHTEPSAERDSHRWHGWTQMLGCAGIEQQIKPIERVPAAWDFQQRIEPIERIL